MQYGVGQPLDRTDSGLGPDQELGGRQLGQTAPSGHMAPAVLSSQDTKDSIDMESIDPIPELEQQLMHALHGEQLEQLSEGDRLSGRTHLASGRSASELVEGSGAQSGRTAASPEDVPHDKVAENRGSANFRAWLETRRKLDGNDAEFVIEYQGDDGQVSQVDLMKVKYEDLPAPVRAAFERRKFPDLNTLIGTSPPGRPTQTKSEQVKPMSDVPKSTWQEAGSSVAQQESTSRLETEDRLAPDEDPVEAETYGRPRYASVPGSPGFGISFGGLTGGVRRVTQGDGRAKNETGRAAVNALAGMREGLGLASAKPREWFGRYVSSWRDQRANQALEKLASTQAEFESALRLAHEHPDLKKHFRSWNVPRTAATRQRAIQRFEAAMASGNLGEDVVGHVRGLFQRAEHVRVDATEALRRVKSAGHGVEAVQRGLAVWLKRMSERAGPLTNLEGESLGEKLMQMADAINRLFERVADRLARLTAVRPT